MPNQDSRFRSDARGSVPRAASRGAASDAWFGAVGLREREHASQETAILFYGEQSLPAGEGISRSAKPYIDIRPRTKYKGSIDNDLIELLVKLGDRELHLVDTFARVVMSVSPNEQDAILEAVLAARAAAEAVKASSTHNQPGDAWQFDFKPGTLKLNAEFRSVASQNQWANRDRSVWGNDLSKIVDFLKATYEPWLGRGMTQADLRDVDKPAYQALHNYFKGKPQPLGGLALPTLRDANLARMSDPRRRHQFLAARAHDRERKSLSLE